MKAIGLWQPFGSLILLGHKTLESRTWNTKHRGDLLICATKKIWPSPYPSTIKICEANGVDVVRLANTQPTGVALCVVNVVNSRKMERADDIAVCAAYHSSLFVFELEDIRPVKQIRVKCGQGFFNVDDDLIEYI